MEDGEAGLQKQKITHLMLKGALLWGRTIPGAGHLPSSFVPIGSLSVSTPGEFAIQEKKNANARVLARGGGGGAWAQLELTDA